MTHLFDDATLAGVLRHMNGDHADDNVLISRAFFGSEAQSGETQSDEAQPAAETPEIVAARMIDFDGDGGRWEATLGDGSTTVVAAPWPGGPITERAEVRREVVAIYDEACRRLGVEPRPRA